MGPHWLLVSRKRSSSWYELNLTIPCADGAIRISDIGRIPPTVNRTRKATFALVLISPLQRHMIGTAHSLIPAFRTRRPGTRTTQYASQNRGFHVRPRDPNASSAISKPDSRFEGVLVTCCWIIITVTIGGSRI